MHNSESIKENGSKVVGGKNEKEPMTKDEKITLVKKILLFAFSLILAIICLLPIYLLFINATRGTEAIRQGVSLFPGTMLFKNIGTLLEKDFPIFQGFINSVIISFSSTALCLYFSSLTAFAFVMYNMKGKKALFTAVLVIIMMPGQLSMIGFYQLVVDLKLYDTWVPLIVPAISSATTVFFLKQYMESNFPKEIAEAARVDGAKEFSIFNMICLPMIMPALATMGIFGIVGSWNNYMGPLMILSTRELFTLPMLVELLKTDVYATDLGSIYAGIFLTILPLLIIYAFFSRQIVAGVALGGVKE